MKNKFLATLFLACSISTVSAQTPVYMDDAQPIEARVKDALSRMTLEEKVALCHAQSKFSSAGVPRLGIPELWMSDGPHGVRAEINWNDWGYANWTNDSITAFPALTCLAATWNPDMSAKYGKAIGEEARYREKDVLLGPGVNIYRTPMNGRNFEYMGEDPYLASVMCVPYIQELQKNGVAACVKHYALNNQELWRGHIDVNLSDRALYEIYLPAFKAAVEEGGAWSIMGAYNKIRGQHACHNDFTLNKILKDDWKFDGCVITDWGGAHDTYEAAVNGLDIEMGSYTNGLTSESVFTYNDYYLASPYLQMLKDGKVPMSTIDDKASRILRLIFRTAMNRQKPYGSVATEEHYAAAREIGNEGIVLLKNAPVVKKGARNKNVYLPEGTWIDYNNKHTAYSGEQWMTVDAPLNTIPMFVKQGSIIPQMPVMNYTDEKPVYPVTFEIFPAAAGSETTFSLYEDAGTDLGYLRGEFMRTPITCQTTDKGYTLKVGTRTGEKYSLPGQRNLMFCIYTEQMPKTALLDGQKIKKTNVGKLEENRETEFTITAWCPDKKLGTCLLRLPDDGKEHIIEFIY